MSARGILWSFPASPTASAHTVQELRLQKVQNRQVTIIMTLMQTDLARGNLRIRAREATIV